MCTTNEKFGILRQQTKNNVFPKAYNNFEMSFTFPSVIYNQRQNYH